MCKKKKKKRELGELERSRTMKDVPSLSMRTNVVVAICALFANGNDN